MEAIAGVLGVGMSLLWCTIVFVSTLAFCVVAYIFDGMSMYAIAKRRGIPNAWMAWVPVVSYWMLGSVADDYSMKKYGDIRNLRTVLLVFASVSYFGSSLFELIPVIGSWIALAVTIVLFVFRCMAYYKVYESCKPEKAMAYLMLSIFLLGIPTPFLLMSCRNSDDGMPSEPQE